MDHAVDAGVIAVHVIEEGGKTYENVGIHLKGAAGSFRGIDDRPALTLNFDKFQKGQDYHDLDKIHLNNSVQDPSYLNELICSELGAALNLSGWEYVGPYKGMRDGSTLELGRHKLKFIETPHVHHWDSMMVIEETTGSLFPADLFIQPGEQPAIITQDLGKEMCELYRGAGIFGGMLHAVNHSFTKAALFLVAGNILAEYRSKSTSDVRGVLRLLPASGVLWIAGFALLLSLLATIYPSWRASRVNPAEALRYE